MAITKFIPIVARTTETGLPQIVETTARLAALALTGADPGRRLHAPAGSGPALPMTANPSTHRRYSTESTVPGKSLAFTGHRQTGLSVTRPSPSNAQKLENEPKDEAELKHVLSSILNFMEEKFPELADNEFMGLYFVPAHDTSSGSPEESAPVRADENPEGPISSPAKSTGLVLHQGHRPTIGSMDGGNPPSGQQQRRSFLTLKPTLNEPEFADNFRNFFDLITNKYRDKYFEDEFPGIDSAVLKESPVSLGANGLSAKNMQGIEEHGYDFSRHGTNWKPQFRPGLHTTHDPFHLLYFAMRAAREELHMKNALQVMALFRRGPDQGEEWIEPTVALPAFDSPDNQTGKIAMGKYFPPEILLNDKALYTIVPLPEFSQSDSKQIQIWLDEGMHRAGFIPLVPI
jgi:hypothetical protein